MIRKHAVAVVLAFLQLSCSSTPEDLGAKTTSETFSFAENYQEIYRRISTAAKRCMSGVVGFSASMDISSDLYSDLGYGEVNLSTSTYGVKNYYWSAKIEKTKTGSSMSILVANTLNPEGYRSSLLRWASGDMSC